MDVFTITFMAAFLLTWGLKKFAISQQLLDIPNLRSSHSVPTPRGGGLAIVVVFLSGLVWLSGSILQPGLVVALFGAGLLVAAIGFLDDRGHVPARWRLFVHFIAAGWAIWSIGGAPSLGSAFFFEAGWFSSLLVIIYLVWVLNFYNFMDGIDGIAGVEALSVCLGGVLLSFGHAPEGGGWLVPALLFSAVAGFLVWNLPPAKIFMGDVGSGFLGIVLGIISVASAGANPSLFWAWNILLGVFFVDATITLLRRVFDRCRFYEAHRSHAYQNAARKYGEHRIVTLVVGGINFFWLLPWALLVGYDYVNSLFGIVVAYAPLIFLAFHFNAGISEKSAV